MRIYCEGTTEWPQLIDILGFPRRSQPRPNVSEIAEIQVQDLVPVKQVEVRVLSSAVLMDGSLNGRS
jgi:hypothetical protein